MKRNSFRTTIEAVLIYDYISWTLTTSLKKDSIEIMKKLLECCVPSTDLGKIIHTINRYIEIYRTIARR